MMIMIIILLIIIIIIVHNVIYLYLSLLYIYIYIYIYICIYVPPPFGSRDRLIFAAGIAAPGGSRSCERRQKNSRGGDREGEIGQPWNRQPWNKNRQTARNHHFESFLNFIVQINIEREGESGQPGRWMGGLLRGPTRACAHVCILCAVAVSLFWLRACPNSWTSASF